MATQKTALQILIYKTKQRIKELNAADAKFCEDRWNMELDYHRRNAAREASNECTGRRQELENHLKELEKLLPVERERLIEARRNGRVNSNNILGQDDETWYQSKYGTHKQAV